MGEQLQDLACVLEHGQHGDFIVCAGYVRVTTGAEKRL